MNQNDFVALIHTRKFDNFWHLTSVLFRAFFRIETKGSELVPDHGAAIIVPNHSGYSGMDAIMLSHLIHAEKGRLPKMMAHKAFFEWFQFVRLLAESFGLKKACISEGIKPLLDKNILILFPEAETGNFKPSVKKYQLQPFHTGFVRLAITTQAPIVPCLIIGAEDSYFSLGSINLTRFIKGLHLPIPLNLVPLPAKWKIVFLEPILLKNYVKNFDQIDVNDHDKILKLTKKIQSRMQRSLNLELRKRKYTYFPIPSYFHIPTNLFRRKARTAAPSNINSSPKARVIEGRGRAKTAPLFPAGKHPGPFESKIPEKTVSPVGGHRQDPMERTEDSLASMKARAIPVDLEA